MINRISQLKKYKKWLTILLFASLAGLLFDSYLSKDIFAERYGINSALAIFLFAISEVFFILGLLIMAKAAGLHRIGLARIVKFDFSNIKIQSSLFFSGLIINRIAAIIPWIYILTVGIKHLPLGITTLIILEITIVIVITIGALELTGNRVKIRAATEQDIDNLYALEKKSWPEGSGATRQQILSRINIFPEGNLIAEINGEIVGYVSTQIINSSAIHGNNCSWSTITDSGTTLKTHTDNGDVLFGINLSIDPGIRRRGLGGKLLQEIGKMAIKKGLKQGILGSRIPDFHKHSEIKVDQYITLRDSSGKLIDHELRFYERQGLKIIKSVKNYFPDKESLNYGVLCAWDNPFYSNNLLINKLMSRIGSLVFRI